MKIMPINSYSGYSRRPAVKNQSMVQNENVQPAFKGEAGKIVGALLGGAAAVGLAFVAAPVLACAAPALGLAGAVAGDKVEKEITEEDNKEDD